MVHQFKFMLPNEGMHSNFELLIDWRYVCSSNRYNPAFGSHELLKIRSRLFFRLQLVVGGVGSLGALYLYEHKIRSPNGGNSMYHELSMDTGF